MKYYNLIGQLCVVHNYRAAAHVYLWLLLTCHCCTCATVYITHVCLGYVWMVITFNQLCVSHMAYTVYFTCHMMTSHCQVFISELRTLSFHYRQVYKINNFNTTREAHNILYDNDCNQEESHVVNQPLCPSHDHQLNTSVGMCIHCWL